MSKQHIFERFLSVGKSQAKTRVVFQAKTQANIFLLNWAPELREFIDHHMLKMTEGGVLRRIDTTYGIKVVWFRTYWLQ